MMNMKEEKILHHIINTITTIITITSIITITINAIIIINVCYLLI